MRVCAHFSDLSDTGDVKRDAERPNFTGGSCAQQQQLSPLLFEQPQLLFPQPPQAKRIRITIRISQTQEQSLLEHIRFSPHFSCSALSYGAAGKIET